MHKSRGTQSLHLDMVPSAVWDVDVSQCWVRAQRSDTAWRGWKLNHATLTCIVTVWHDKNELKMWYIQSERLQIHGWGYLSSFLFVIEKFSKHYLPVKCYFFICQVNIWQVWMCWTDTFVLQVSFLNRWINPLRANIFRVNKNIYLHFMPFLHIDMTRVIEILPQVRQGPTYST